MKKVLLALALGALMFSCAKDEVATSKNEEKMTMGIVNPGDPDMNRIVGGSAVKDFYINPTYHSSKGYLMINETNHSIRMNMYVLPKFSNSQRGIDIRGEEGVGFFIFNSFITPKTENHGKNHGSFPYTHGNYGPTELWDHMYSNNIGKGIFPTIPGQFFWHKYPAFYNSNLLSEYKVAFIEFWVQDGNYEGKHHWMSLETINSFNQINIPPNSIKHYPLPFSLGNLSGVSVFSMNNELPNNPLSVLKPSYNLYYMTTNGSSVSNKAYDFKDGIDATFRYMPHVSPMPLPLTINNPDSSPGYIIKFENL